MPEDERNFSTAALEKLKTASRHILYLINEGYDLKQATVFVGNHFLLSERQRLAIMRSITTDKDLMERKRKLKLVTPCCLTAWMGRSGTLQHFAVHTG